MAVVALTVIPAVPALDSRSFFSPDEANYAQVAREMLERRDFVVPHRDGQVWLNKPPLAHWLLAGAFTLLGWGFAAAVVTNSLLTALTAWLVARHAGRQDPLAGWLAAGVYLTMFLPLFVARSALTDAALTACTTASVFAFLSSVRGAAPAAGVFLGLGMLAKGPVAPLVVLPAWLATVLRGESRRALARVVVAVAASLVVVVPWLAALAVRGVLGMFVTEFLGHEVLSRAVDEWNIAAPAWVVAPMLWAAAFPWGTHLLLPLLPAATPGGQRRWLALPRVAEAAAVGVPLLAFALARGKLPHYVLPVLPFLAVWLGQALAGRFAASQGRGEKALDMVAGVAGASVLVFLARELVRHPVYEFLPPWLPYGLGGCAVAMASIGACAALRWRRSVVVLLLVLGLGIRVVLDVAVLPVLEEGRCDRPVAEAVRLLLPQRGVAIAHRWFREAYLAYGPRGWQQTASEEELAATVAAAWQAGQAPLVVASSASEGEVRGVAWRLGGEAQELFRFRGLVERHFMPVSVAGFAVVPERSGERFFCDFEGEMPAATGFWGPEGHRYVRSYRWTAASTAALPVTLPPPPWVLRLRAWGLAREDVPQTLAVRLDGCSLGVVPLGELAREFVFPGAPCSGAGGAATVTFSVRHLVRPQDEVAGSEDPRLLGVALDWLAIEPLRPEIVLGAGGIHGAGAAWSHAGSAALHPGFTAASGDLHPVAPR